MRTIWIVVISFVATHLSMAQRKDTLFMVSGTKQIALIPEDKTGAIQISNNSEHAITKIWETTKANPGQLVTLREQDTVTYILAEDVKLNKFKRQVARAARRLDEDSVTAISTLPVYVTAEGNRVILKNEFLISFKPEITQDEIDSVFENQKVIVLEKDNLTPNTFLIRYDGAEIMDAVKKSQIFDRNKIKYITPNFIQIVPRSIDSEAVPDNVKPPVFLMYAPPDDTLVVNQWYLSKIQLVPSDSTHDTPANIGSGKGVTIAILDIGVDIQHEDLSEKIVSPFNATNWSTDQRPEPDQSHGTKCAGVAAAITNNHIGISGTAWDSKVMPIRIGVPSGKYWNTSPIEIRRAFDHAIKKGARVLSCSWKVEEDTSITEAIEAAVRNGCVVVCAAGNDGYDYLEFPARLSLTMDVISVTAVNQWDEFKTWESSDKEGDWASNYGPGVTVCAPGVNIFTTTNTSEQFQYMNFRGTSSATPIVAGAAAMILSVNPALTPAQVKTLIQNNSDSLPGQKHPDEKFGYGRLNVRKLLQAAQTTLPADSVLMERP